MKQETFSSTVETAYGQVLQKAIKVSGTFDAFETIDEVKAQNAYPSDDDVLKFVNAQRKQNARAKATTAALEAAGIVKPTLEDSKELQRSTMIKVLEASGKTREQAEQIANSVLG